MLNRKFNSSDRINYINHINEILVNTEKYIKTKNPKIRNDVLIYIKNFIQSIKNGYGKVRENPFGNFIKTLVIILTSSNIDMEQFAKFIEVTKENTNLMIKSLKGINDYIKKEGSINENLIYEVDQLGGKKFKKYYNSF